MRPAIHGACLATNRTIPGTRPGASIPQPCLESPGLEPGIVRLVAIRHRPQPYKSPGLVPGMVRLVATPPAPTSQIPRPCAGDGSVGCYASGPNPAKRPRPCAQKLLRLSSLQHIPLHPRYIPHVMADAIIAHGLGQMQERLGAVPLQVVINANIEMGVE
jgi:hypothetical protein